jgi:thiamine biosynthesis lipoprotein
MHHIVDPASGAPADPVWRSVTVAAPTCLEANTLATAAVVKGHAGLDWLRGQGLPARLVDADRRVVLLAAWPEEVAA